MPAAVVVGLDRAGADDRGRPSVREGSPRSRSPGPGPSGSTTSCITASRPVDWRRIRRRGRSTSIASSEVWTRESWGPRLADPSPSRRSWASTPRTARWASATRASSWSLRPDVERPEPVEELGEIADGRVAEDLGLAILADARDPLGEVGDEPGELVEEGLLGELDGLLEPGRDPRPLGLVEPGRELDQVVGRLDVGEIPVEAEQADQGLGIVRRVEQRAQPLAGGLLELAVVAVEVGHGVVELGAEVGHLGGEGLDLSCLISRTPGSGKGRLKPFQ